MDALPDFEVVRPKTLDALIAARAVHPQSSLLGGGTDLIVNIRRGIVAPKILIETNGVTELRGIDVNPSELAIGAAVTLTELAAHPEVVRYYPVVAQAAAHIAGPTQRNMGTVGGNLCLDTRCNYYDQNYEWRKAIDFCLKKDGTVCWVAPGSAKCMAVSSTDTAPALIALGARVRLASLSEQREILLADLYNNDGLDYIKRRPDEILAEILLDNLHNWKSTYWKLRRRGSFDFPVLSVAAAVRFSTSGPTSGIPSSVPSSPSAGIVEEARIVIGSAASRPILATEAAKLLIGRTLTPDTICEAATQAAKIAKPLDNTDFDLSWRKKVTAEFVSHALRELAGQDTRPERQSITRLTPPPPQFPILR